MPVYEVLRYSIFVLAAVALLTALLLHWKSEKQYDRSKVISSLGESQTQFDIGKMLSNRPDLLTHQGRIDRRRSLIFGALFIFFAIVLVLM